MDFVFIRTVVLEKQVLLTLHWLSFFFYLSFNPTIVKIHYLYHHQHLLTVFLTWFCVFEYVHTAGKWNPIQICLLTSDPNPTCFIVLCKLQFWSFQTRARHHDIWELFRYFLTCDCLNIDMWLISWIITGQADPKLSFPPILPILSHLILLACIYEPKENESKVAR